MLAAWSLDIAELWDLQGMLGNVRSIRPCPRCLLPSTDMFTMKMADQQRQTTLGQVPLRTVTRTRERLQQSTGMPSNQAEAFLREWSLRSNMHQNVFLHERMRGFDICQDADFDELHMVWSGWIADLHNAIQAAARQLGAANAKELHDRLCSLPPFPNLLNLEAYSNKSTTAKVCETLLQVKLEKIIFFLNLYNHTQ